jgi:hypothetical protein
LGGRLLLCFQHAYAGPLYVYCTTNRNRNALVLIYVLPSLPFYVCRKECCLG